MGDAAVTLASAKAAIEAAMSKRGELYDKWHQDFADHAASWTGRPDHTATIIRDMLFHAALLGLIDAVLAETLSQKLNGKPLANVPTEADFDARLNADWTLPMTVAWIMARDWRHVTRQKADFRSESEIWRCTPKLGLPKNGHPSGYLITNSWTMGSLSPPSIENLILGDAFSEGRVGSTKDPLSAADAKPILWRALQEGYLTASGCCDHGSRQVIPPMLWQDLNPMLERWDGPETLRAGAGDPTWRLVTVRRDDVLQLWPSWIEAGKTGWFAAPPITPKAYLQNLLGEMIVPSAGKPQPIDVTHAVAWIAWRGDPPADDVDGALLVASYEAAARELMDRIAIGSIDAFGQRAGRGQEPIEARWFRNIPIIFDLEVGAVSLDFILGERGPWFCLATGQLDMGYTAGWPHQTRFDDLSVNSNSILEAWPPLDSLQAKAISGPADNSGDTPAHRTIRRAVRQIWPDDAWRDLPVKTRNARINVWAEAHGGQRYGDTTIQRALRDLR